MRSICWLPGYLLLMARRKISASPYPDQQNDAPLLSHLPETPLPVTLDRASLKITIDKIDSKNSKKIKPLILKRMKNNRHIQSMTLDNESGFLFA